MHIDGRFQQTARSYGGVTSEQGATVCYNVHKISVLYFYARWPHYMTKINYVVQVSHLQPEFTKVSTECVIDSHTRKQ